MLINLRPFITEVGNLVEFMIVVIHIYRVWLGRNVEIFWAKCVYCLHDAEYVRKQLCSCSIPTSQWIFDIPLELKKKNSITHTIPSIDNAR
jgi:hypothetical protein